MFFETIYATNTFAGEDGEFVLSYGDPVGAGYHGDFIMGWQSEDFLQQALDTCQDGSGEIEDCPLFDIQSDSDAAKCTFDMPKELKEDNTEGPREGLAVDVPVQWGPEDATAYPVAGQKGTPTTSLEPSDMPSTFSHRTLTYSPADPSLTSTAQFGIIVAKVSQSGDSAMAVEGPTILNRYFCTGCGISSESAWRFHCHELHHERQYRHPAIHH